MNNNVQVSVNPTRTTTVVISDNDKTSTSSASLSATSTSAAVAAGASSSISSASNATIDVDNKNKMVDKTKDKKIVEPAAATREDEVVPEPLHTTVAAAAAVSSSSSSEIIQQVEHHQEKEEEKEEEMLLKNDDHNDHAEEDDEGRRRPDTTGMAKVLFFDSSSSQNDLCWIHINNVTFLGCGYQGQSFLTKMSCYSTTTTTSDDVVLKISTTTNLGFNAKYGPYEVIDTNTEEASYSKDRQIYHTLFPTSDSNNNHNKMRNHFYVTLGIVPKIPINKLYSSLSNNITDVQPECSELIQYKNRHQQHQANNNNQTLQLRLVTGTICDVAKGIPFDKYYNITTTEGKTSNINAATTTNITATTTTTTATTADNHNNSTTTTTKSTMMMIHGDGGKNNNRPSAFIIVKQLICIWRHKFYHRFLHEDIVFNHLYIDSTTGHVGMIDFQQADMLDYYSNSNSSYGVATSSSGREDDDSNNIESVVKHARDWLKLINQVVGNDNQKKIDRLVQMMQLYQLLQVISNVCMDTIDYMNVGYKANLQLNQALSQWKRKQRIWKSMEDHLQEIQFALQECNNDFRNNNSSLLSPGGGGGGGDDPPKIIIKEIPVMLYERYKHVLLLDENNDTTTTTTTVEDENGKYDVVVGHLYDMLLRWVNVGNNGAGDDVC